MPSDLPHSLFLTLIKQGVICNFQDVSELSGGRTNRVWRFREGDRLCVLKLFAPEGASSLFPNDPRAEHLILKALNHTGLAPDIRAAGSLTHGRWILYAYLPGQSWDHDAGLVGVALRKVHALPGLSGLRLAPNGSADVMSQTLTILGACRGAMATALRDMQPPDPSVSQTPPRVIHGDPVPANILISGSSATFIDWQCPALGDPCDDLAIFLSPAMQHIYRGKPLSPSEYDAFFASYDDADMQNRYQTLAPLFHWRMAAHCLWKAERGADDYAKAFSLEHAALLDAL